MLIGLEIPRHALTATEVLSVYSQQRGGTGSATTLSRRNVRSENCSNGSRGVRANTEPSGWQQ